MSNKEMPIRSFGIMDMLRYSKLFAYIGDTVTVTLLTKRDISSGNCEPYLASVNGLLIEIRLQYIRVREIHTNKQSRIIPIEIPMELIYSITGKYKPYHGLEVFRFTTLDHLIVDGIIDEKKAITYMASYDFIL